ncbi:MAG: Dabb family protein [Chloroflexota bacterium]
MVRHVALFRWSPEATPEAIALVTERLLGLKDRIPELRRIAPGPDIGGAPGHWDYAVVADFDDLAGYQVYAAHPDHLAVVNESIVPIRADRAVLQYEAG